MDGLLTYDGSYSVSIASTAVQDGTGNLFAGLTSGIYAFRTVAEKSYKVLEILIVSVFTVAGLAFWQRRRSGSISPIQPEEIQETQEPQEGPDGFQTMKELQNLKSWHGAENFETLFEELRMLRKEDDQTVAYQPPLDDSYYATMEPLSAGSSTVLEPDLSIINKARPISASRSAGEAGSAPDSVEVYAYYAFPPPASLEKACPPSSGPPALMDHQGDLSLPSTPRMLQDMQAPLAVPPAVPNYGRSRRPMSAHERSKTVIKSLYDSLQSSKPQRKTRPQSAPSQRVQERLVQSRGVALFREFDRRLPSQTNLQTLYFEAFGGENRPKSRPSSATFQRYATVAIADSQFEKALAFRRPTSAGAILRRSQTEPADSWEIEREHAQLREHAEHEPSLKPSLNTLSASREDDLNEVDFTHHTHGKYILEKQITGEKTSGLNLEELRSLGMVWEKPQNARWSSEITQDFSLEGPRQSVRPRQSRISVVMEQESDLQTWEMMLKKAAPTPQKAASPEHSPRNEPGIGMPWTWQSSSIDAVDANQHKDSLASREQTKSGRWNRKSYIWQFQKEEEDKAAAEAKEDDPAGSLGKRHEALGIRSRSSILRTQTFDSATDGQNA